VRLTFTGLFVLFIVPSAQAENLISGTTCPAFKDDTYFHADISKLPKHPRSDAWMSRMGPSRNLHPDFGPSFGELPVPYGIPITVVDGAYPKVSVDFLYDSESDNVPYPLNAARRTVEGGSWVDGDRHTITVDKSTCKLYETFETRYNRVADTWSAGSGAVWDLNSYRLRPNGWTSADAAGLPILPLLLRYDEVAVRKVDHPIRFTAETTDRYYLWPARHHAGSVSNRNFPPMGARFRLRANFPIASYRADTRAVLLAMKKYGLVLADNGPNWHFGGTADGRWQTEMLDELKSIPASAFEAVDVSSLMISAGSMKVQAAVP
jgi:hypothetical protein